MATEHRIEINSGPFRRDFYVRKKTLAFSKKFLLLFFHSQRPPGRNATLWQTDKPPTNLTRKFFSRSPSPKAA